MRELFLDFETRSRLDLRRVGAHRYAEDPSTEVMMAAYALSDGPVLAWAPDAVSAGTPILHIRPARRPVGALVRLIDSETVVVAHNAEFERLMLRHKFGLDLPPSRFRCTAAQAARAGLPRGLEAAAEALGLASWDKRHKDRVIRKLSQPRRSTGKWWERGDAEEEWEELEADCLRDAETCRGLYRLLPQLGDREQALWELTVRMNDRGVLVDLDSVRRAAPLAEEEQARAAREFEELVGAPPASPRARRLLGVESLDKMHVRRYLRDAELDPRLRRALELRKRWARSSLAKLGALLERASADGRLRGQLVYCGAERTARWSSRGVQWHNMPKGLGEGTDLAFRALAAGALRAAYEDPLLTLSDMLKGFAVGPFLIGDFGQIEARDLAWQAGQADLLKAFRAGADPYLDVASAIYGRPITRDDYDEVVHTPRRQLGKMAVLGCGYGLGPDGLRRNAEKQYDLDLSPELAERVVRTYRRMYPRVPEFWRLLERGFAAAVARRAGRLRVGPVHVGTEERGGHLWAFVELPSGRRMWYFEPMLGLDDTASYFGRNRWKGGKWERVRTYGGMLAENVVQATSRDVLAEALLRLDAAGFPLVLQVHDEAVAEGPPERLEEFRRVMLVQPEWAEGLPLSVEVVAAGRYRK